MPDGLISYNGTTYRFTAAEIESLLARGVIMVDPLTPNAFELAREHVIEELGADPVVLDHTTGEEARGEGLGEVGQKMLAVRYLHRDGQGGV